jgi:hypothetical protein
MNEGPPLDSTLQRLLAAQTRLEKALWRLERAFDHHDARVAPALAKPSTYTRGEASSARRCAEQHPPTSSSNVISRHGTQDSR